LRNNKEPSLKKTAFLVIKLAVSINYTAWSGFVNLSAFEPPWPVEMNIGPVLTEKHISILFFEVFLPPSR
jgi:hypothetical protein